MAGPLKLPDFSRTVDTWGPSSLKDNLPFDDLPFVPFTKRDPIGYIADWTPSSSFYGGNRGDNYSGRYLHDRIGDDQTLLGNFSDNESEFQGTIVRTKKYDEKRYGRKDWSAHRSKMAEAHDRLHKRELQRIENAPQSKFRPKQQIMRKKRRKKLYENPRPTTVSIKKSEAWQPIQDLWFNSMMDMSHKAPSENDGTMAVMCRAGKLSSILTEFDSIRCRTPTKLASARFSDSKYMHFDYVSASNDDILLNTALKINRKKKGGNNSNLAKNSKWNVYTTDTIMALLMCINRSKYSFDIVISKIGKNIFLDQRSRTNSYWQVDETSQNRPTKKGTANMNKHTKLAIEATFINHVFSEQLVSHRLENAIKLERQNPFQNLIINDNNGNGNNNNTQLASKAFIYKVFDLNNEGTGGSSSMDEKNDESNNKGNNVRIYARCCVHGYLRSGHNKDKNNLDYVNIYALNQYDHLKSKTNDWNKDLDQGMSGILLTEIANNAFKMSRMAIESYLVGANTIKFGFITRVKTNSVNDHQIVGVRSFNTKEMIGKCNINLRHEWGILSHIINIVKQFDDGRFIAVRDPLKQVIRFYRVEPNAFGKDDELPSLKDLTKKIGIVVNASANNNKAKEDDGDE